MCFQIEFNSLRADVTPGFSGRQGSHLRHEEVRLLHAALAHPLSRRPVGRPPAGIGCPYMVRARWRASSLPSQHGQD